MRIVEPRYMVLAVVMLSAIWPRWAASQTIDWARKVGTTTNDVSHSVSADRLGNVYISGYTQGALAAANNFTYDAFVSKFDASGSLQWSRQLHTTQDEVSRGVSADGLGNVYISGDTYGSLQGTNAGDSDAFVSKYSDAGTLLWTRQLGTSNQDSSTNVSADRLGNVFITGYTYGNLQGTNAGYYDAFVTKYDSGGTLQWTRQLGTIDADSAYGVSADGLGNVYISGFTGGDLDGTNAGPVDAFVSKYDGNGAMKWTRQFGTVQGDVGYDIETDARGNVYVSGYTYGSLEGINAGFYDAFVSKYRANGTLLWTRQLGTTSDDLSLGISVDEKGGVYIGGYTRGNFEGGGNDYDGFISRYDARGNLHWTRQIGTANWDEGHSVSADGFGHVFISGQTNGPLDGPSNGSFDAFLVRLTHVVPEPASILLFAVGLLTVPPLRPRRTCR